MRLRSRGLGRKELVLDFREYEVVRVEDEAIVVGTIRDPINWDFTIRICEDDVPGMTWLMLQRPMLVLLLRSLAKRLKKHHWSQERAEHLAEGKRRRQMARGNAEERARGSIASLATRRSATTASRTTSPKSEGVQTVPGAKTSAADTG